MIKIVFGLILIVIVWFTSLYVKNKVVHLLPTYFANIIQLIIIVIGVIIACGIMDANIGSILASLGLTSLILGFALKDIIANATAGLIIWLNRPFIIGDYIIVDNETGKVISIELQHIILAREKETILVPNSKILTNLIIIKKDNYAI